MKENKNFSIFSPENEVEPVVDLNTPEKAEYLKGAIQRAKTIANLVQIINNVRGIPGSRKFFSQNEMANQLMTRMWFGKIVDAQITNNLGWRDKIQELFSVFGDHEPLALDPEKTRKKIEMAIESSKDIGELIGRINSFTGLMTEDNKSYTALEINKALAYALEHKGEEGRYNYLTRDFGLRRKVRELIESENR